jgi:predicted peptidase
MLAAPVLLFGGRVEDFQARSFTDSRGKTLVYRLHVPKDYDASKSYPIVTFLHGSDRKGSDNRQQMGTQGATVWARPDIQKEHPCFVFVPQCPRGDGWRVREGDAARISALLTVEEIWDTLEKEFSIDSDRRYLTGQSGGGGGVWLAMMRNPDRFAAAAIVCAGITFSSEEMQDIASRLKDMPLWLFHGSADQLVPVSRTRDKVAAMRAAGGSPRYCEYAGVRHNSWERAFAEPDLPAWLFSQSRSGKPHPDWAAGVRERDFKPRTYTNARGDKLPYCLFIPKDYDPQRKYPLVLFLHGGGERGTDNRVQLRHTGPRLWATPEIQSRWPCFVVAPQCPTDDYWGVQELLGTTREDRHLGEVRQYCPIRSVWGILDDLEKEFSIDTDREYITGLSMGGRGTWESLRYQPNRFAAAIPICAGMRLLTREDLAGIARITYHVPLWIFHGTDDQTVPVQYSRDMVEALRNVGGSPRYTEYPGVLHNSWIKSYREPGLADWLFAQRRQEPCK